MSSPRVLALLAAVTLAGACKGNDKPKLKLPSCLNPAATLADGDWKQLDLLELRSGTETSLCVGTTSANFHYADQSPDQIVKRFGELFERKGWTVLTQKPPASTAGSAWPVELVDRDYVNKDKRWLKLRAMHYPEHAGAPVHVVVGILTGTPP